MERIEWIHNCPGWITKEPLESGSILVTCYYYEEGTVDNLIPNPSFEGDDFSGWRGLLESGGMAYLIDDSVAQHGLRSVRLSGAGGEGLGRYMTRRDLPVMPGELYGLKGWMLGNFTGGIAQLVVNFWGEDMAYLGGDRAIPAMYPNTEQKWYCVQSPIVIAPEDARFARVECRIFDGFVGQVWFDYLYFGPPDPPEQPTFEEALMARAEALQVIRFNPEAALQKALLADGFVPNSGEFDMTYNGKAYRGQRAEHLGTGEVRVYFAVVGDWEHVSYIVR